MVKALNKIDYKFFFRENKKEDGERRNKNQKLNYDKNKTIKRYSNIEEGE